jgi:hypothetical protein
MVNSRKIVKPGLIQRTSNKVVSSLVDSGLQRAQDPATISQIQKITATWKKNLNTQLVNVINDEDIRCNLAQAISITGKNVLDPVTDHVSKSMTKKLQEHNSIDAKMKYHSIWLYPLLAMVVMGLPVMFIYFVESRKEQPDFNGRLKQAMYPISIFATAISITSIFLVPIVTTHNIERLFIKLYNASGVRTEITIPPSWPNRIAWIMLITFVIFTVIYTLKSDIPPLQCINICTK